MGMNVGLYKPTGREGAMYPRIRPVAIHMSNLPRQWATILEKNQVGS